MKTAIVILNYNSKNDTIKYVNSIKNYKALDTIVVVDNNSTNPNEFQELEKLKSNNIFVIKSDKNGGYSYGNNFGLRFLDNLNENYDYVVISNPDVEVNETSFEKCFKELEQNENVGVTAPLMTNKDGVHIRRSSWKIRKPKIDMINSTRLTELLFYKWFKAGEYSEEEYKAPKLEVECISGAFFAIKFDLFKKIGFFDENVFLFYEEDIISYKLQKLGYKEISLNDISFKHFESSTISKVLNYYNKIKRLQESKMYFQKKYNNISKSQIVIFTILNYIRRFELLFEIPIKKLLKK